MIIDQGPIILQWIAGKDESLLIRRDFFLVLDFGLETSMVSVSYTSRAMVFTKICIPYALATAKTNPRNITTVLILKNMMAC
jgi:hypothetical protein